MLAWRMWPYAAVFLAALLVDSIPVFAPPAWTLIVVLVVKFKLDPWLAAAVGAFASTLGRYFLSAYMPKVSRRLFDRRENENIAYLGRKLGGRFWRSFAFVFAYSLTPLSTTALFTAAGSAKVDLRPILPAFFLGKLISDVVLVLGSRSTLRTFGDILKGQTSPKSMIGAGLGLALLALALFIDWRELLERRRLRLRFRILRRS
jgi:membrane protein YqaA with SNARE-associated domain